MEEAEQQDGLAGPTGSEEDEELIRVLSDLIEESSGGAPGRVLEKPCGVQEGLHE